MKAKESHQTCAMTKQNEITKLRRISTNNNNNDNRTSRNSNDLANDINFVGTYITTSYYNNSTK